MDICVFYANVHSNSVRLAAIYLEKTRKYEHRVHEVEKASFVSVVFSCASGAGLKATVVLKRLTALITKHKAVPY